jgi:hypothetical protein
MWIVSKQCAVILRALVKSLKNTQTYPSSRDLYVIIPLRYLLGAGIAHSV